MTVQADRSAPPLVMICATEIDRRWVGRLYTHLQPQIRSRELAAWDDAQVPAGENVEAVRSAVIERARIAVLLLTPDLLGSDDFDQKILPALIARGPQVSLFPVLVRPCGFRDHPLLAPLRPIPASDQYMGTLSETEQDRVLMELAQSIRRLLNSATMESPRKVTAVVTPAVSTDTLLALRELVITARRQTELILAYKLIHDQLHSLQFHVYNAIAQQAARFSKDPEIRELFAEYAYNLGEIITALRGIANSSALPAAQLAWFGELDEVQKLLKSAIEGQSEGDVRSLRRALHSMKRILSIRPAEINQALRDGAASLRLKELGGVSALPMPQHLIAAFVALVDMDAPLTALISDHTGWQNIEVELVMIESSPDRDAVQLEDSLPWLTQHVEALCNAQGEPWAQELKAALGALTSAMVGDDPAPKWRTFKPFRRLASKRFFEVDVTLKHFCDKLHKAAVQIHEGMMNWTAGPFA